MKARPFLTFVVSSTNRVASVIAISLLMFFGSLSHGEEQRKFALVIGGGGEPPGKKTTFDKSFKYEAKVLKKAGFDSTVVFNGGHQNLESIASDYFPSPRQDVSSFNIRSAVNQLIARIKSGEIHKGDQLLISVLSHGLHRVPDDTVSHRIVADGDSTAVPVENTYNLDELTSLRDAAEAAGIRFAILDQSCYSGATLKLATAKTCVVTVANERTVGFGSDIEEFWDSVDKGMTLEQVYLKSRLNVHLPSSPSISSSAGETAAQFISEINANIAQGYEAWKQIHLEKYIKSKDEVSSCNSVVGRPSNKITDDLAQTVQGLFPGVILVDDTGTKLRSAIENYQSRAKAANELGLREIGLGVKLEQIGGLSWSWDALAEFDLNLQRRDYGDMSLSSSFSPIKRDYYRKVLSTLDQVEERRKQLLSNGAFKEYLKLRAELASHITNISSAVRNLSKEERKFYDAVYRSEVKKRPNPCQDFKF